MAKTVEYKQKKSDLLSVNFRYAVDVDYDTDRSACSCSAGYCRCGTIVGERVEKVYRASVVSEIARHMGVCQKNQELLYCVDRIASIFKLWRHDIWEISKVDGYYGQEINKVGLKPEAAAQVDRALDEVLKLPSFSKQVEALLVLEYGYLLDDLKDCRYSIERVLRNKIGFQREHYRRLDRDAVNSYVDYKLPLGVVLDQGGFVYRLIDGYHRVASNQGKAVPIIVASR